MVLDKGEKYVFIENASRKTIYNIRHGTPGRPCGRPAPRGQRRANILLCDSRVNVAAQRAVLPGNAPQHHQHRRHHAENGH